MKAPIGSATLVVALLIAAVGKPRAQPAPDDATLERIAHTRGIEAREWRRYQPMTLNAGETRRAGWFDVGPRAIVDHDWERRVTALLGRATRYAADSTRVACTLCRGHARLVLMLHGARSTLSVLLFLPERSVVMLSDWEPIYRGAIRDSADELLTLAREAFPRDTTLRNLARIEPHAEETARLQPTDFVFFDRPPRLLSMPETQYPDLAREAHITGTVVVEALVGADGRVTETLLARSIPLLDAEARRVVLDARFEPAQLNGSPIRMWVNIPIRYTLH